MIVVGLVTTCGGPIVEPTGEVDWRVVPASLGFVATTGATPPARSVALTNEGDAAGDFRASSDAAWLEVRPAEGRLAPGAVQSLTVAPAACGGESRDGATLTIEGGGDRTTVAVTRVCSDAPSPVMTDPTPDPLELSALVGATATGELSFANAGKEALDFAISVEPAAAAAWLRVEPASGSVAAGADQVVRATAACPAEAGSYPASLRLATNDPALAERTVAVALRCTTAPAPALTGPLPPSMALDGVLGEPVEGTFTVGNAGTAALFVDPESDVPWLQPSPSSRWLEPGEERTFIARATCPVAEGELAGTLRIETNDAAAQDRKVAVALTCAPPPPPVLDCREEPAGAARPTLVCAAAEVGLELLVPWQGRRLEAVSLPLAELADLPSEGGFEPTRTWPVIRLAVREAGGGPAVTSFSPPATLRIGYGEGDVTGAGPRFGAGELGLGAWDAAGERWLVAGRGVFESGFWVADPIGEGGLALVSLPDEPRFAMGGDEAGGRAQALLGTTPPELVLGWGALPADPDRMFVPFKGCVPWQDDGIECVSDDGAVTVRVPLQDGGVVPRAVALPWNLAATLEPTPDASPENGCCPAGPAQSEQATMDDRLMNFLVVDAASGELLTSFAPPLEIEIPFGPSDFGERDLLRIVFWDEVREENVVLGEGNPVADCFDTTAQAFKAGCPWGRVLEAIPTDDPAWRRPTEEFTRFYKMNPPDAGGLEGNGRAKFRYDQWGDRMVGLGN